MRPIPMYPNQDGFYTQKHFKTNSLNSLDVLRNQLEHQSNFETISYLETIRNVANALIYEIQAEQAHNPLFYANQFLNSMNNVEPIIPKLELSIPQLCLYTDTLEASTNGSTSGAPSSPESIVNSAEKVVLTPVKPVENQSESDHNNKGTKGAAAQSKFKNLYGLVTGKVIKSIIEYLRLVSQGKLQEIIESSQYYYIHQIISSYSDSQKEDFMTYLKGYYTRSESEKKNRGKGTALKFLEQDVTQGLILVELIQSFLERNNSDFQRYISDESNHKKQVSHVLSDEKNLNQLRNTFKEMQHSLEKKIPSLNPELNLSL
jgi:hypothetical protein